jgi:ATP-dependent Lhr-like helicase
MGGAVELLHPKLRGILPELGYSKLLPVQEKAIPAILSKHHTLIIASTGSGKTEAAILPVPINDAIRGWRERPRGWC